MNDVQHDGMCEAEYVIGAACYTDCRCIGRELDAAVNELVALVEATAHE